MPIGNASIRRAAGAMEKTEKKPTRSAFHAVRTAAEIELTAIDRPAYARDCGALQKSIKKYGILFPVFVIRSGERFLLADGHARCAAAAAAGLQTVPALILELEGSGASSAQKDVLARMPRVEEELCAAQDIQEEKFNAIRAIGTELPDYLL